MVATYNWCEDNGAQTGSPAHGTVRSGFGADTNFPNECNWKNADNNAQNGGVSYTAAVILAGNNSYAKYQYGHFSGSFNQISAVLFTAHDDASAFGAGLTLMGTVTSTYSTPGTGNAGFAVTFTAQVPVASGITVSLTTAGPECSGSTASCTSECYTQYFPTQLLTTVSAVPGDTNQVTLKLRYNEN